MKNTIRYIIIGIFLLFIIFFFKYFGISKIVKERIFYILDWIQKLGPLGPITFIIIYIVATVFLLSGAVLTLGAGALFGVVNGVIISSIGSIIGATLAFLIGRYLVRGWISHKIEKNSNFIAIDNAVAKDGWKIVGLTRLSPVLPFVLLNYSFGITKVSLRDFFFSSWICMLPGTTLYVYIGSLLGNLATIEGGKHTKSTGEWVFYIIGLIATLAVTIYVTRISKKALDEKIKKL
jgi:uncharacterized membrane protein YdjX (TVP38/TMEM64 family)